MAIHTNEVSDEAKAIFSDVRVIGRRVMDRFYEGFALACRDVNRNWKNLKPRERKIVFEKVQDVAKYLIVDMKDGGGAKDGLSIGTFHGYVCKVKRALIFHVPLQIAERATNQELQQAQKYVEEILVNDDSPIQEKMEKGYNWVKEQQVKLKEQLKAKAEAELVKEKSVPAASLKTSFTLPDPSDYEKDDESSDTLLKDGIQGILSWLQTKDMKQHIIKDLKSAKVLRHVLGELVTFDRDSEEPKKKTG